MDAESHGFYDRVKLAISAGMTLGLIKGRVAQGARVAPALMQRAEQAAASGMSRTAPTMRHLALSAGDSARMATKAQGVAPLKAGLTARMAEGEKMIQNGSAFSARKLNVDDYGHPIHDAFGHTHGYSPQYMSTVAGSKATIADPKGVMRTPPPRASLGTAATQRVDPTQVGQMGGRNLAPANVMAGVPRANTPAQAAGTAVVKRRGVVTPTAAPAVVPTAPTMTSLNRQSMGTAKTQLAFQPRA